MTNSSPRRGLLAATSYAALLGFYARDVIRLSPLAALTTLCTGALAIACEVGAILIIVRLGRAVESAAVLDLPLFGARDPRTIDGSVLIGSLIVALLALAALLNLASRLLSLGRWRAYEAHIRVRLASLLHLLPSPLAPNTSRQMSASRLRTMLGKDARYAGISVHRAISGLFSLAAFAAVAVSLLTINPALTLVVGLVAAIGGLLIIPQSRSAARASLDVERLAPPASRARSNLVARALACPIDRDELDQAINTGPIRDLADAVRRRLRAIDIAECWARISGVVAIALVLAIVIIQANDGIPSWGSMIGYVIAMTVALARFAAFIRTLTSLNRFVPQLRRLREATTELLNAFHQLATSETAPSVPASPFSVHLNIPRVVPDGQPGAGEPLTLGPNSRVAILGSDWAALGSIASLQTDTNRPLWTECRSLLTPHALTPNASLIDMTPRRPRISAAELNGWIEHSARSAAPGTLLVIDAGCLRPTVRSTLSPALACAPDCALALLVSDAEADFGWAQAVLAWDGQSLSCWATPSDFATQRSVLPDVPAPEPDSDEAFEEEDET